MRGYGAEVNLALAKPLVAQHERIASLEGRINKLEGKK